MSGIEALAAIGSEALVAATAGAAPVEPASGGQVSFSDMLMSGVDSVEAKVEAANDMVRQFAIDDSVPVHQVTMALEEARLAVEIAMQVRTRLVEGYREIMNMQL